MNDPEPLASELREAETTLKSTLDAACASDVSRADTGELIRVEEMLAIASDAAKRAISIRRRRGHDDEELEPGAHEDPDSGSEASVAGDHRHFTDDEGTEWMVRAVLPSEHDPRQARLLGSFQHGWLAFECDMGKRRLSPIPDDWERLDDAGLRHLWARAEPAATRRDHRAT
jgi:hypothetical protein